jgi:4-hydroxy-tetrahydrodipicolinate reductase
MQRIAMFGICGKMGTAMAGELIKEEDIDLVAGFDSINIGTDLGEYLGTGKKGIKITDSYKDILNQSPDLIIDFTIAEIAKKSINWAIDNSIDIIVGTTGLSSGDLAGIEKKAGECDTKVLVAPNFAIGAVIMMKISGMIAKYFDNSEIIEKHHDKKKDAPSGTSIATAKNISKSISFNSSRLKDGEDETIDSSRGGFTDGVHIHSIRLPGFLAHQEVIFGTLGQTLSIKHDSINRSSFYPGIIFAVRNMDKVSNYTYGLDKLIDLGY